MRSVAANAELALLLEVAGTPKPGNVDREREFEDLRFEHFLAGAVGARPGLRAAADGEPIGAAFERSVAGMSEQRGGNTQFGALLLLVPLVRAAADGTLSPEAASAVVEETTVADAAAFYRAFEYVDVAVGDPPDDMAALDVRRGADAVPEVESRELALYGLMERSADVDDVAREWTTGFERTFAAADRIADGSGPVPDRAAETFLWLLARRPDTFVAKQHGEAVAAAVTERAREARSRGRRAVRDLAEALVEEGKNPGTTADVVAAALFVALERDGVAV